MPKCLNVNGCDATELEVRCIKLDLPSRNVTLVTQHVCGEATRTHGDVVLRREDFVKVL